LALGLVRLGTARIVVVVEGTRATAVRSMAATVVIVVLVASVIVAAATALFKSFLALFVRVVA